MKALAIGLAGISLALLNSAAYADLEILEARQIQLNRSLEKVQPALVAVQDGFGAGSGVVVSKDGIVLTASHVVETRRRNNPRLSVTFPDGSRYNARLLGMNRSVDAAMLKITESPRQGTAFPYVELGDSDKLQRGDWCFALGHPGGFRKDRPAPVRLGRILSAGHRTVVSDCAIVLGDSGGPLFDLSGKLIGIHSMITEVIVENRHVAVNCYRRDGDRMENGDRWGSLRAYDSDLIESDLVGVTLRWRSFTPEISRVLQNSAAEAAGLRTGDILLKIADQTFADPLGLSNLLEDLADNQKVDVLIDRHGEEMTVKLTTGKRPVDEGSDRRERIRFDRSNDREREERLLELQNQLTSMRNVGPFEKRSIEELQRYEPLLEKSRNSVAEFRRYGETVALGTVMSADGYILTKASEIDNVKRTKCILADGRSYQPRQVAVDYAYDLMLMKIDANDLLPAQWATQPSASGTITITTDSRGAPILPGVVSVETRKLPTSGKGFLGVSLQQIRENEVDAGVEIRQVLSGGAALRAGLEVGDVIQTINGQRIYTVRRMISLISSFPPNKKITIRIRRDQVLKDMDVVLTPRFLEDDVMLPRYSDPTNLGQFASAHNSGYPQALQHDTDLYPHQCGGPLFNIYGEAIGLNIARAARITSYAIPAAAVQQVFAELKAKDSEG